MMATANAKDGPVPTIDLLRQQVSGLISTGSNESRQQAEEAFNKLWIDKYPHLIIPNLCLLLGDFSLPIEQRSLIAILIRRFAFRSLEITRPNGLESNVTRMPLWSSMEKGNKKACQQALLECMTKETHSSVKSKIADAIVEIYRITSTDKEDWPELLPYLFQAIQNGTFDDQECVLNIISDFPEIVTTTMSPENIMQLLMNKLNPSFPISLKVKTMDTMIQVQHHFDKSVAAQVMNVAMPVIWSTMKSIPITLSDGIENDHTDDYNEALSALIQLADDSPKLLRSIVPDLLSTCTPLINDANVDESIRHSLVELIVTLCEGAPVLMKKQPQLNGFIQSVFVMLSNLPDDDDEWADTPDTEEYDDNDMEYAIAEQTLDRLACALDSKIILPQCLTTIQSLLSSQKSWKQRHAGLMAIACVAEGFKEALNENLSGLLLWVFEKTKDPHMRVRYAACQALGQLSNDFQSEIQSRFHGEYFHYLLPLVVDKGTPKVQAHAIAALITFCNEINVKFLLPYLAHFLPTLFQCLGSPRADVQEKAVNAIASIAEVSGKGFTPYYSMIMTPLLQLVRSIGSPSDPSAKGFRARTIEAITIIASSVSKETFTPHVREVVSLLSDIQDSSVEEDDPVNEYLLSAWVRVCVVLGTDFAPLLPKVLPPLIQKIQIDPTVRLLDDEDLDSDEYSHGWYTCNIKGKNVAIHTASLDEKADAVENLGYYATALGPAFANFAEQFLPIVLPVLKFDYFERAQTAAAKCLPLLLSCIKQAGSGLWLSIWYQKMSLELLSCINRPYDSEVIYEVVGSITSCLEIVQADGINEAFVSKFVNEITQQLVDIGKRIKETQNKAADENDEDYEDDENAADEDVDYSDYISTEITKSFHEIFKHHGASVLPLLNEKIIYYYSYILSNPQFPSTYRHDAICFFDDIIEYTGPESIKYSQYFLQPFATALTDDDPDIRQAVAYGIGVAAKSGGTAYAQFCSSAIPVLLSSICVQSTAGSEERESFQMAVENAVSAVAKICLHFYNLVDLATILPTWLSALPITEDESEFECVYSFLAMLIESAHPYVMSGHSSILKVVLQSIALLRQSEKKQLADRLATAFRSTLLPKAASETLHALWSQLSEPERKAISELNIFE